MNGIDGKTAYLSSRKVLGLKEDQGHPLLISTIEKIVGASRMNAIMEDIGRPWPEAGELIDILFDRLDIRWSIENPELLEGLSDGPKVFVANHPYGLPDAFAMFKLLTQYRSNIRIFANKLLAATQLEEPSLLFVDPFGAADSRAQNRKSIASALRHLREGGDLALFPGRICSHLKTSDWTISDSEWTDQVRKFVEVSGGELVPLYISGRNSMLFNLSGLIHPKIRTYMLLREFLRGGHDFTFRVGEPVSSRQIARVSRSMSVGSFSRSLVYALKTGAPKVPDIPQLIEPELRKQEEQATAHRKATSISGKHALQELKKQQVLLEQGGYTIYQSEKGAPDALMEMICEVRFAAYAQQTKVNNPSELKDRFDDFYSHLVLWDNKKSTIVGVYRYTLPNVDLGKISEDNLVTNSIFELSADFRKLLPNAMELGRAAILPEYQKSYSPLMLLWRAILEVPRNNKDIKYLFGPVTMGQNFNPVSRELLRRFVMRHWRDELMDGFIKPKLELDLAIPREVKINQLEKGCSDYSKLGNIVSGFEGGQRSLPVLFRHYANVGCKYIGFGEWKELDNATTGITILDLENISPSLITRYFGEEGARSFLAGRANTMVTA